MEQGTKPKRVGGYTRNPHQTVPESLARDLCTIRDQRDGRNHAFTAALLAAREAEWGVPALAAAVGADADSLSRRMCRGRYHPQVQAQLAVLNLRVPRAPVPAAAHPASCTGPTTPALPESVAAHLRQLHDLCRDNHSGMPRTDHVCPNAGIHLVLDIRALLVSYTLARVADGMRVTPGEVSRRLRTWGPRADAMP